MDGETVDHRIASLQVEHGDMLGHYGYTKDQILDTKVINNEMTGETYLNVWVIEPVKEPTNDQN